MDTWCYRVSVACDAMEFEFILLSPPLVWSTPPDLPGRCDICMHQHSTTGIRQRRRRRHSTYWHMAQCKGVGWLLWWFALITNIRDIRERNVTIKSVVWTMNIRSLRFRDIRKWVILWGLTLGSLGCNLQGRALRRLRWTDEWKERGTMAPVCDNFLSLSLSLQLRSLWKRGLYWWLLYVVVGGLGCQWVYEEVW